MAWALICFGARANVDPMSDITMQSILEEKLSVALAPSHLQVINESGDHNVPQGSESHFKVVVVSPQFEGKSLVARHRQVYGLLADELANSIHALALHTKTPAEWEKENSDLKSPPCLGGSKK